MNPDDERNEFADYLVRFALMSRAERTLWVREVRRRERRRRRQIREARKHLPPPLWGLE